MITVGRAGMAARPAGPQLRPRPAFRRPPRVAASLPRAQRSQAPPQTDSPAPQLLKALETAALALAVGAHVTALVAAQQQVAATAQQQVAPSSHPSRRASQVALPTSQAPQLASSVWPAVGGVWLTLPLLAAVLLGRLRTWLSSGSTKSNISVGGRVSSEAAARLLRVEAAASQQAQQLEGVSRQLDKLAVRSRLVGRDLKLPIQQLQAAAGQQADALVAVAQRMERLEKEIKDTEELVGAMQGVSAKQFNLLLKVLEQQQAQQQAQRQAQAPAQSSSSSSSTTKPGASGGSQGTPLPAPGKHSSSSSGRAANVSGQLNGADASSSRPATAGTPNDSVDEWGRRVVPLPLSAAPPSQQSPAASSNTAVGSALSGGGSGSGGSSSSDAAPGSSNPSEEEEAKQAGALPGALPPTAAFGPASVLGQAAGAAAGAGSSEQQQQQEQKRLSLDSLLGIMQQDAYFQAEQEMIRALVNQPRQQQRPEVEVLPPLFPPSDVEEESPRERKRREQVEEWRQRVARSWQMAAADLAADLADARQSLEAALAADNSTDEGDNSQAGPDSEASAQAALQQEEGEGEEQQQQQQQRDEEEGGQVQGSAGGQEGAGTGEGSSPQAAATGPEAPSGDSSGTAPPLAQQPPKPWQQDGVDVDNDSDDGSTTFHFH